MGCDVNNDGRLYLDQAWNTCPFCTAAHQKLLLTNPSAFHCSFCNKCMTYNANLDCPDSSVHVRRFEFGFDQIDVVNKLDDISAVGSFMWVCSTCKSDLTRRGSTKNEESLSEDPPPWFNKYVSSMKMQLEEIDGKWNSRFNSLSSDIANMKPALDSTLTVSPVRKQAKIAWDKDDNPVIDRFATSPVYPLSNASNKYPPTSSYASKVKINVKNSTDTSSNLFRNLHDSRNLIPKYTTKKKSDGSVDVILKSFEEADKAKSVLMEKFSETVVSKPLPEKFKKFTLVGPEFEMSTHEVVDSIADENSWLNLKKVGDNMLALKDDPHAVIQVLNVAKCRNASCYKVGIQMSLNMAATVGNKKLSIGHSLCYSYKFVNHRRCYRCQEPGHIANTCTNTIACSRCSHEHFSKNCNSNIMKCINCVRNGKDDVNHPSYSPKCPCNNT